MEKHQNKLRLATIVAPLRIKHRLRPLCLANADVDLRRGGHGLCRGHGDELRRSVERHSFRRKRIEIRSTHGNGLKSVLLKGDDEHGEGVGRRPTSNLHFGEDRPLGRLPDLGRQPRHCRIDRRELAAWGPSHDSLLDSGPEAVSVNFFPLPSGSFCVSRTTPAGWESQRPRRSSHVHALPDRVARGAAAICQSSDVLLLRRCHGRGRPAKLPDTIPARLEPLELRETGTSRRCGPARSIGGRSRPRVAGHARPGRLDQRLPCRAGTGRHGPLDHGLLDCLPVDCRTSISFSTGLKFSTRRPFDLFALPDDAGPATVACPSAGRDRAGPWPRPGFGQASWSTIGRG